MRFDGYPKYVSQAAAELRIEAFNPDGTVCPTGKRIHELVVQNNGLKAAATLIGQAVDPRNPNRRAILAVAQQHAAAVAMAARAAELMVDEIEAAMNREDWVEEPEPDTIPIPPEPKQPSKRR